MTRTHDSFIISETELVERHLLLVQPISSVASGIDEQIAKVSEITGQHKYTLRQKLVGETFDILSIGSEMQSMQEQCNRLQAAGFAAALVDHSSLEATGKTVFINTLEQNGERSYNLINSSGETVGWIDNTLTSYITVGSLKPELYGVNKALLGQVIGSKDSSETNQQSVNSLAERVVTISREKPALILQLAGSPTQFVFESGRFNFNTLPGNTELSISLNFQRLVQTLSQCVNTEINADFGLKTFPYGALASKPETVQETRKRFLLYSQIAFAGYTSGLTDSANLQANKVSKSQATSAILSDQVKQDKTLPPPTVPTRSFSGEVNSDLLRDPINALRPYGPPTLIISLMILALGLLTATQMGALSLGSGWVTLPFGALLAVWSLTMTLRKRAIEQLPTSRIRSMPTGTVEIYGEAERKYQLQAPCSLTNCVHYSYKVLTLKRFGVDEAGQPRERWAVVERGDSGPVPFYLNDGSGKVLVDPAGAVIAAGQSEEYAGDMLAVFAGAKPDSTRRVIETVIPEGARLYVIGHARPQKNSATLKQREYLDRLRTLKSNPEAMSALDTDGDGEISYSEWEVARAEIEQNLHRETLAADNKIETVVVGRHPTSGIFYITGKSEPEILSSYSWKIPLSAALAFITLAWSLSNIIG